MKPMTKTDWNPILRTEFAKPYWAELQQFVVDERQRSTVYPPHDEVFAVDLFTAEQLQRILVEMPRTFAAFR